MTSLRPVRLSSFLRTARAHRLRRVASLWAVLAACGPSGPTALEPEAPPPELYAEDDRRADTRQPDPTFVPDVPSIAFARSALSAEGEIIVIEGDDRTVSSAGGRAYGITEENANAIMREVLAQYPDVFDTIQVYLTFPDAANPGAAYYRGLKNEVQGIGQEVFDLRAQLGLPADGRLSGFSNMNDMALFGSFRQLTAAKGPYFAVIAQELSHRWLMMLRYAGDGGVSDALKGRQDAHWSALVHAYGSVQDGVAWLDQGDGVFVHDGESNAGFAPFDRYAMGILPPAAVEPTFRIRDAHLNGRALTATSHSELTRGIRVHGTREPITIDQVVSALGPRNPPAGTESPYYRAAFVLVTRPGQPRAEWEPYVDVLKEVQRTFPETWKAWTGGAGAICTRVRERCPEPVIGLELHQVRDKGDGNLAPGEPFELAVALRNTGLGRAEGVRVSLEVLEGSTPAQVEGGALDVPPIGEGDSVLLPSTFKLRVADEAACGGVLRLRVRSETREGPVFDDVIELPVGTRVVQLDPLEDAADWRVNPDRADTAEAGAWGLGEVELISAAGVVTQPAEDHSPGEAKLSFQTGARKGDFFADHDVDGGTTTLESPVFPLRGLRDPTLVFYAWHVATDLSKPKREPVPGAALLVLGTDDGGATWREMARVEEETASWKRVEVRIRDTLQLTNRVRFRFQITDVSRSGTVEAGVDDLAILDVLDACTVAGEPSTTLPDEDASSTEDGGGCRSARGGGGAEAALLALVLLGWARRRSHRAGAQSRA